MFEQMFDEESSRIHVKTTDLNGNQIVKSIRIDTEFNLLSILKECYNSQKLANALVELGDMSELNTNIKECWTYRHDDYGNCDECHVLHCDGERFEECELYKPFIYISLEDARKNIINPDSFDETYIKYIYEWDGEKWEKIYVNKELQSQSSKS
jgi:hypothetical protein